MAPIRIPRSLFIDDAKQVIAYHFLHCQAWLFFDCVDSVISEDSSMEYHCGLGQIYENGSTRKKAKYVLNEEKNQVDRISSLPESILAHILSLVPTRNAINTVLIRSFGRLWTQTHNIDFDLCTYHGCQYDSFLEFEYEKWSQAKFVDFVNRALSLHKSPQIHKFRIKFEFSMEDESDSDDSLDSESEEETVVDREKLCTEVNSWIEFALKRNVKVLDLDFLGCGIAAVGEMYELPEPVFRSSDLVELRVVSCDLKFSSMTYMKALKSLYLKEVELSNIIMDNILLGCPVLETLSLIDCYGLRELRCYHPNVRKVVIAPEILEEKFLTVSCPYITSLSISGWIERVNLSNLSSLQDATVDFCDCSLCDKHEYVVVWKIIAKIVHVKVLTIYHKPILGLMMWELLGLQCPSSKWETLILKTPLTKWHLYGIINLLRNSPYLKTLEIHLFHDGFHRNNAEKLWVEMEKVPEEVYWLSQGYYFCCLMSSLKVVKISGDVMKEIVVKLMVFLLGKALVLKKLVISTNMNDDYGDAEWAEFTEKLLKSPRASSQAVVVFVEE